MLDDGLGQEVQKHLRKKRQAQKWACNYNTREQKKLSEEKNLDRKVDSKKNIFM